MHSAMPTIRRASTFSPPDGRITLWPVKGPVVISTMCPQPREQLKQPTEVDLNCCPSRTQWSQAISAKAGLKKFLAAEAELRPRTFFSKWSRRHSSRRQPSVIWRNRAGSAMGTARLPPTAFRQGLLPGGAAAQVNPEQLPHVSSTHGSAPFAG